MADTELEKPGKPSRENKRLMGVRIAVVAIVFFGLGFGAREIIFRRNVYLTNMDLLKSFEGKERSEVQNISGKFINYVDFDGNTFKPDTVKMGVGNYLAITNQSKTELMQLLSENQDLTTLRGYGEGERLQTIMPDKGIFKVMVKGKRGVLTVVVD